MLVIKHQAGNLMKYEMKGIPIPIRSWPKDIEKIKLSLVRRDTKEKESFLYNDQLEERIPALP